MDAENGKSGIGSVASVLTNLSSFSSIDMDISRMVIKR